MDVYENMKKYSETKIGRVDKIRKFLRTSQTSLWKLQQEQNFTLQLKQEKRKKKT